MSSNTGRPDPVRDGAPERFVWAMPGGIDEADPPTPPDSKPPAHGRDGRRHRKH